MAARLTAFVVSAIVAITFVAGLIVGAQREDDSGPIDLIVYNARVYVGDPAKGFAEAIAIRGNRILKVGSNRDIKRLMRRATTLIDAQGGSVLPGFNDAGLDLFANGFELDTVRRTIADAHRAGLTSAHVVLRSADDLVLLEDLEKRGELTLRVSAAMTAKLPIDAAEVDRLEAIRRLHPGDALLKVSAVKLTVPAPVDINAKTLASAVSMLDQKDWQVIVAPGNDEGVQMALEAFQQTMKTPRADNTTRRHRIDLPGPIDASTSARFDALGIVQSFESAAAAPETPAGPGGAAAAEAAPATSANEADAAAPAAAISTTRLAPISSRAIFRSDWPARPLDPRITFAAAVAENAAAKPDADTDASATATESRTSRAAWLAGAIDAYTSRAAYATFDEARKGTLAKDMLADLVIFSSDMFSAKTTSLTETTLTTTVSNGRIVYSADKVAPALSTAP